MVKFCSWFILPQFFFAKYMLLRFNLVRLCFIVKMQYSIYEKKEYKYYTVCSRSFFSSFKYRDNTMKIGMTS